jgi:hypothetical protein
MNTGYDYNSHYLMKDGKAWFPVMGEMHYSRYLEALWEEALRKMKAGGLNIVSTYVIWIHHEEEEGRFDFTGQRNLKQFIRLCKKVGLSVFLRIGPWVHGEVRNGGFPDWLQNKEKEGIGLRSNDEKYLAYVRVYWEQVFNQVRGFFYKEGGPIIGLQIENEYGHVGGLQGEAGEAHIRTLTALAKEIGFQVPFYTATGWGGACIGDLLPVMGGYCEAPWDPRTCELEANTNFVFSHTRNDALIACDHHVEGAVTFDETKFPFLTAELGGGLQVTRHRRPVASGKDIGAMTLAKLGSGVAMIGYYMYHGGSNPKGKLSTLQESKATGYLNDLPEINYDFNAPIRQYGTISDSYREIKLLAYFLLDFGEDLTALEAKIEPENIKPEDTQSLRLAYRNNEDHGYVFFNNYQRRRKMNYHSSVTLTGPCKEGDVVFPAINLEDGVYGFFPYRMKLGEAKLISALATPFCILHTNKGDVYVFYGDNDPQYRWVDEKQADILHISRKNALNAWKVSLDQDYLLLSDNYVWEEDGTIRVTGGNHTIIKCFPEPMMGVPGFIACGQEDGFAVYERYIEKEAAKVAATLLSMDERKSVYEISIRYVEKRNRQNGQDVLLLLTYAGEKLEILMDGQKINDHFYTGQEVPISLGYFNFPEKLTVVIDTLNETDDIFMEHRPEFHEGKACALKEVKVVEEYR